MRVYFLSAGRAALKLDGQFVGMIDMFERFADIDLSRGVFAEIAPCSCRGALNFFIDEGFFHTPHAFCNSYYSEDERGIYISRYPEREGRIEVIAQGRAAGALITVFRFGGIYAAAEPDGGGKGTVCALSEKFCTAKISAVRTGGCEYAAVRGQNALALFRGENMVFFGGCGGVTFGEELNITERTGGCTRAVCHSSYSFDGEKFALSGRYTRHSREPAPFALAAAFFESVLCGGAEVYLSDELKGREGALKEYLGGYTDVALPSEGAQKKYGPNAAGLVYERGEGLFEVKYFIAEISGGKVINILPAGEAGEGEL